MSEREAREFCAREDTGRERYLKNHFNADINDPLFYHLILNTGLVSFDESAKLIAEALRGGVAVNGKATTHSHAASAKD